MYKGISATLEKDWNKNHASTVKGAGIEKVVLHGYTEPEWRKWRIKKTLMGPKMQQKSPIGNRQLKKIRKTPNIYQSSLELQSEQTPVYPGFLFSFLAVP